MAKPIMPKSNGHHDDASCRDMEPCGADHRFPWSATVAGLHPARRFVTAAFGRWPDWKSGRSLQSCPTGLYCWGICWPRGPTNSGWLAGASGVVPLPFDAWPSDRAPRGGRPRAYPAA